MRLRGGHCVYHAVHGRVGDNQPHYLQGDAIHRLHGLHHQRHPHQHNVLVVLCGVPVLRDSSVPHPQGEDLACNMVACALGGVHSHPVPVLHVQDNL